MRILIVGSVGITNLYKNWPEYALAMEFVKKEHYVESICKYDPTNPVANKHEEVVEGIRVGDLGGATLFSLNW